MHRGLAIIYDLDIEAQKHLFNFGAHLGIAFQVHDDILDYTQNSEQLGKPAFNDIKEVLHHHLHFRWYTKSNYRVS